MTWNILHDAVNMAENVSATLRSNIKTYFTRLLYQSSLCLLELWFSNFAEHTTPSVKSIYTHTHISLQNTYIIVSQYIQY